ncbi:MAG: hypothetical protein D6751_03610, partial [Deltaproteobacteria bacterium]
SRKSEVGSRKSEVGQIMTDFCDEIEPARRNKADGVKMRAALRRRMEGVDIPHPTHPRRAGLRRMQGAPWPDPAGVAGGYVEDGRRGATQQTA